MVDVGLWEGCFGGSDQGEQAIQLVLACGRMLNNQWFLLKGQLLALCLPTASQRAHFSKI